MPIINFDYSQAINGSKDHRIKGFLQDGATIIEAASANIYSQNQQAIVDALFDVRSTDKARVTDTLEDGYGEFIAVADGNAPDVDQTNYLGERTTKMITFRKKIAFTKTFLEDEAFSSDSAAQMKDIPELYYQTRARIAMKAYANGENSSMSSNGVTIDLKCYDGNPLFYNTHTYGAADGHAYGTQTNKFYNVGTINSGFVHDTIRELAVKIRQLKNANGEALGYDADTILVPGNAGGEFEDYVYSAVGSNLKPGTSNNDINTIKDNFSIIVLPDWNPSGKELIVLSSRAMAQKGATFYDRTKLECTSDYDKNHDILNVFGRGRFGLGFTNYTFAALCKLYASSPDSTSGMTAL